MQAMMLYVVFEPPFWVGIIERDAVFSHGTNANAREYARIVFGSEPPNPVVYDA
ncbi:MAG: DUF2992 family protein [Candidatus Ozemobacteraceae bacterium]